MKMLWKFIRSRGVYFGKLKKKKKDFRLINQCHVAVNPSSEGSHVEWEITRRMGDHTFNGDHTSNEGSHSKSEATGRYDNIAFPQPRVRIKVDWVSTHIRG